MKAAKARASSAGSSSRNTREKVSCEGAPCGSGTSAESSSALPSENSAISTQLLAPHSVAAKARNRTDAKSWRRQDHGPRAKSRSSWPSGPSPKRKAPSESSFKDLATQYSPKCDSPARTGEGQG